MEDLFVDKGDERHHSGFNDFRHNISVKNPEKLNARLNMLKCWKMKNSFIINKIL